MFPEKFIAVPGVERIANLGEPVLRNLQITQSYHVLSTAMTQRTGRCANWCTFAAWASKQAGQTIRREDLARAWEQALNASPVQAAVSEITTLLLQKGARLSRQGIGKLVWDALNPTAILERSSRAVAQGNQKVYAEIGREFARFIATCLNDITYDAENIARFCAALSPGDPPGGQRYLRQAFLNYYASFFEPDAKTKAEHILLANLQIGFHEQTRLQPEIAEALEASVGVEAVELKRRLLAALFPGRSWLLSIGSIFTNLTGQATPLDVAISRFLTLVKQHIRRFLTERLMVLCFPNEVQLRLGDDLKSGVPDLLKQLKNMELLAMLSKIDPTPDSLQETGAEDWANLPDRLHFIADMFRCHHENADLLLPPFEEGQVSDILADKVPLQGKL